MSLKAWLTPVNDIGLQNAVAIATVYAFYFMLPFNYWLGWIMLNAIALPVGWWLLWQWWQIDQRIKEHERINKRN